MMIKKTLGKTCALLTLITTSSIACTTALAQTEFVTVSSILENPVDGQEVNLRGQIIGQEQGESDYIFTDGTNQITIELEDEKFEYNPNTTVEISGVINMESEHSPEEENDPTAENIEIEVSRLQVVTSNE